MEEQDNGCDSFRGWWIGVNDLEKEVELNAGATEEARLRAARAAEKISLWRQMWSPLFFL